MDTRGSRGAAELTRFLHNLSDGDGAGGGLALAPGAELSGLRAAAQSLDRAWANRVRSGKAAAIAPPRAKPTRVQRYFLQRSSGRAPVCPYPPLASETPPWLCGDTVALWRSAGLERPSFR